MTIASWVGFFAVALIGIILFLGLLFTSKNKKNDAVTRKSLRIGAGIVWVVTIIVCGLIYWYGHYSAAGQRAYKDQQANLQGGLERLVTVYDINGQVIKEYRGKFDVETDNSSYILFDDENNLRHIIYYTTGTVIIDEVPSGE
jgi:hypothetical protein